MHSRPYRNLYSRHSENCNEICPKDMRPRGRAYPEIAKNIFIWIIDIRVQISVQ